MPRNPNKHPCASPGCHAWAMRDGTLCGPHAGHVRVAKKRPAELAARPKHKDRRLPTLEEEISLLAGQRDDMIERLQERLDGAELETGEALRYLAVLAQVGKSLAGMLVQRAAAGDAGEIERFFEAVANRVQELQPGGGEH